MPTRTSHSNVTFRQPFRVTGMDSAAPAGSYDVDLEEERLDTPTVQDWRQTAAILQVKTASITEYVVVDPLALRDAMLRDSEAPIDSAAPQMALRPRTREILRLRRQ